MHAIGQGTLVQGGTFYSMQHPTHPPLPFAPFPDLTIIYESASR